MVKTNPDVNKDTPKSTIQRTLVLIKSDGVQRQFIGKIIQRFEDVGLKIVGMKMKWADEEFAKKHYFDVEERKGPRVFNSLVSYLTEGPVIAMVLEGIDSVELVRKMVGSTEPKSALPGTIRGDFSQHSYGYTDDREKIIRNLIHASGKPEEAEYEIKLWFSPDELHTYKTVHEFHVF